MGHDPDPVTCPIPSLPIKTLGSLTCPVGSIVLLFLAHCPAKPGKLHLLSVCEHMETTPTNPSTKPLTPPTHHDPLVSPSPFPHLLVTMTGNF